MQQAGFHHANMLVDCLQIDLQLQGSQMLDIVQELSTQDNNSPNDDAPPPKPAVNATVQDSVQLEMLRLLREMSRDRQGASGNRNGSGGRGERNGGRSRIRKTPDNASFVRRQTDLYY